jgi:large subunit ribosomal protein L13Ae
MSTFSSQPVVIDGKAHLLGRLASVVSKQVSWVESVESVESFGGE